MPTAGDPAVLVAPVVVPVAVPVALEAVAPSDKSYIYIIMCQPCRTIPGRVFSTPQRPHQIKMSSGFLIGLTAEKLNKIINKTKIKNLFCLISVPLKRPT